MTTLPPARSTPPGDAPDHPPVRPPVRPPSPPDHSSDATAPPPEVNSPPSEATLPASDASTPAATDAPASRIPFPLVDEISRHCLQDGEPETVHIEVHLPGRLDHARLRTAFHQALARHPRILMRQAPVHWWHRRYTWQLTAAPDTEPVVFPPRAPDALLRARERALTDSPPLDAAPPVRLEVVEHPDPDEGTVLLLTLHHTALDGPACLRVLATTAELYGGADNSPSPPPVRNHPTHTPATPSSPQLPLHSPQSLHSPLSPESQLPPTSPPTPPPSPSSSLPPSPSRLLSLRRPARLAPARLDRPAPGASSGPAAAFHSPALTTGLANGMLLTELPVPARPPRTDGRPAWTVNDQLLVAICLMAARWNHLHDRRTGPVVVTMPVDDRPRGSEMPIGNGTRLVPVGFGPEERSDTRLLTAEPPDPGAVARLLHRTAARTRALKAAPGSQLGLGAALLTTPVLPVTARGALTRALRGAAAPWTSTTLLSNIGRVPYPLDFGDAGRPTAVWFSAPARMPRGLTVTTVSVDGRIQLALRWSHALLDAASGARLADLFARSLAATAWSAPPADTADGTSTGRTQAPSTRRPEGGQAR